MTIETKLIRNHGHPFTGEKGWDLLLVATDTENQLDKLIDKAMKKFWKIWIRDNTGKISAVMYKPTGIKTNWVDDPSRPR